MKTYIWATPMRLFHWFLFLSLVCAYIVSEEDELLNVHAAFGYVALILILFRIIYGFFGPVYSRFIDFPLKFSSIKSYVINKKDQKQNYPGHNPASAVVMLAILLDVILVGISGILTLSAKGYGLLNGLVQQGNEEFFKESHEVLVNILIILVLIHIVGLIVDFINNRKAETIKSIFIGCKNTEGESVKESRSLNIILVFIIVAALSIFVLTVRSNYSERASNEHYEEVEDED